MENPPERAARMIDAYENHFIGRVGPAARGVANRYAETPGAEDSVLGIRGPYLQALEVSNWSSQSWESFCRGAKINPLIRDAFSDLGFRRLYDFQERTVEQVKEGEDTVVTAATGRGKTEAWLIPILDRILDVKRDEEETSVKAMLIYPTKALAQDQFKRLVQYLYRINEKWPAANQITIGIYDGDTPTNVGSNAQGYLQSSFKYFECPGRNEELEKCRNCGQGVRVHHAGQRYELQPEKRQCLDDVPLDFIRLTKHEILNEGVDILLTNPDTINRKLINVNAADEHDSFVYEPEFLVFDEVHTYDGLFGSYTATLTKRLRAMRSQRDCGDLQVIASSATVENDVELFRKVSGAQSIAHVDERPQTLNPQSVDELPPGFTERELTDEDLIAFARGNRELTILSGVSFDVDPSDHADDRLRELLGDALFDYFTRSTDDPLVNAMQEFHHELASEPRPHEEVVDFVRSRFDLEQSEAMIALRNFRTLGTFSGLLENRTHLFSWPIDGFYACPACDAVYRSPQASCRNCGFGFVTRSTYCRGCDDEALVAWYCPECDQLEPYTPSDEGEIAVEDEYHCQRCRQSRGQNVRTLRVTFQPRLTCVECGQETTRSTTEKCGECGTDMVHTEPETLTCPNPQCEATRPYEGGCENCGADQRPVTGEGDVICSDCGRTHSEAGTCDCGTDIVQTRFIPWVCRNEDCTRRYFDDHPETCDCGSYTFARGGLFEIFEDTFCESCESAFVGGASCDCVDDESRAREGAHQSFKTFEPDGKVRTVSNFRAAAPCSHQSLRYEPDRRYDELVRSPGNLAVTTAQYLLRSVADEEGYDSAKLLSFADSHRDMKELNRDFGEPEVGTLLDQCLLDAIQTSPENWPSLDAVIDGAMDRINELHEALAPPDDIRSLSFDLKSDLIGTARQYMDVDEAIRDRLRRRAVPHRYSVRYREYDGALADDGLVDVRLDPNVRDTLSDSERAVLHELVATGDDCPVDDLQSGHGEDIESTLDELTDSGVIRVDDGYVRFRDSVLQLTAAGNNDSLQYRPQHESMEQKLDAQFGTRSGSGVPFATTLKELADPSHARFNARAYRALYSETRILLSRVYHGMTDKRERRELEYLFREGNYPHFLSSGPTMELGVDIGALDALLLYGTPPNMNAYLQRIGRAGRSSNASLVHSVSQRNPIDYYYYDQPQDLMSADPQPVPLKEYNREVLRVSLTWAVFDYIAANFVIPWDVERHGRYKTVSEGDTFDQRQPTRDDDTAKLTHVMSARTGELDLDTDQSQFDVLATIVHDYRKEIEMYLESMLDHAFCPLCSRKYDRARAGEECSSEGCTGDIEDATVAFGDLTSEAVDDFADRYLHSYSAYLDDLETELETVSREANRTRRERRRVSSREQARELLEERETLIDRREALEERIERVKRLSYVDFLRESRQSRYAFDMRTVSDSVAVSLVDSDGDGYQTRSLADDDGRAVKMAISELHPGAAYLDGGNTYVVSHLSTDDFESSELRQRVREADATDLAEEYICPTCRSTYEEPDRDCECDSSGSLTRQRLVAPSAVTAHRSDLLMSSGGHAAREIYGKNQSEIQNTYAERETDVLSFDPTERFDIETEHGDRVGSLQFGTFTVLVHASEYRAKYKNGELDAQPTPFEVCGDPDCTGIIYRDKEEQRHCSADSEHSPNGDEGSEFVRLGYSYETNGVRVDLGDTDQSHVFAHGFRLALQYLGGVSIRDLTEVTHGEDSSGVDVFDAQEGGGGVARLLVTDSTTEQSNFKTAVELLGAHLACDCEGGCPLCLYQYGCDTRNRNDTFDRDSVVDLIDDADLRLTERKSNGHDH
jgi:ATP-dependent helicase YprA (DUF1998 family)